jgi:hypothetical protein
MSMDNLIAVNSIMLQNNEIHWHCRCELDLPKDLLIVYYLQQELDLLKIEMFHITMTKKIALSKCTIPVTSWEILIWNTHSYVRALQSYETANCQHKCNIQAPNAELTQCLPYQSLCTFSQGKQFLKQY